MKDGLEPNGKLKDADAKANLAVWDRGDLDNPHNWSLVKKMYHTFIPTAFGFLCTFGSSVYTPGDTEVMTEFNVSRVAALLPFTFYLLGLAFGPVIAAPLSEAFGRKVVYLSSVPMSGLFTLGAGFSHGIVALTICRFFAGLFCSPGLSIGTGTVADIWQPAKRGAPMSFFITSVQMGPALGPMIGGFATAEKGWRWTQWTLLFALATIILMAISMSETYKKQILKRRAHVTHPSALNKPSKPFVQNLRLFVQRTIKRPLHMLFTETIVTFFDLYVAINFGILNGFFAAFPYVFEKVYGFNIESVGLSFLGQAVGSITGMILIIVFDKFYYRPTATKQKQMGQAKLPPEERLYIAMAGAPMIPISLFWFGWTARTNVHWISAVAAEALFSVGNLLIFTCASLYLTDCYGALYGASAWSSNTFSRYIVAAAFPLFIVQMYERLGIAWATSLLAFLTVLLMPIPFVFWRYGPVLRKNSKYDPGE